MNDPYSHKNISMYLYVVEVFEKVKLFSPIAIKKNYYFDIFVWGIYIPILRVRKREELRLSKFVINWIKVSARLKKKTLVRGVWALGMDMRYAWNMGM